MPAARPNLSNVYKLYASNLLTGIVLWYGIEKLFMHSIGISTLWISINTAVFFTVTVLLDIPTGVLADKWKRKYVLILANLFLGISCLIFGLSHGFNTYVVGTVFYALYLIMALTTYQTMMYDSLKHIGLQHQYAKYEGRARGIMLAGIGLSSLAGGYVGQYIGLSQAFLWSIPPVLLNLAILAWMYEPAIARQAVNRRMLAHVRHSALLVASQPILLHLTVLLVVVSMLRSSTNEFNGLYYIALAFSPVIMGYVNAGKWLAGALGQVMADRIGRERTFNLLPWFFGLFLAFSLIPHAVGTVFFLLSFAVSAVIVNQSEAVMQDRTPSDLRATTLSMISFTASAIMIPMSLLFGWIAQTYSVFLAFQLFAAIGVVYIIVWFARGRAVVKEGAHAQQPELELSLEPVPVFSAADRSADIKLQ